MDFLEILNGRVTEKRYNHTLGVIEEALAFSKKHHVDENKARIAATLHDLEKYTDYNIQKKICEKEFYGLYKLNEKIIHGFTASITVSELGIDDADIINAIRFHTTGRPMMSDLEKIIYLADFTDPSRNSEVGKIVHDMAMESLDVATLYTLKFMRDTLTLKKEEVSELTLDAIHYYEEKLK